MRARTGIDGRAGPSEEPSAGIPPQRRRGTAAPSSDASGEVALSLEGVRKRFGAITAVDGIDLTVPTGVCFGLLGPNGAGKSTTMRMLTAQAIPDSGRIEVLGYTLPADSKQARAQCGVVPQEDNLDEELTTEQNLSIFARLYRVPARERRAAIDRALASAKLTDRATARVDELSGGMRRRLLIARALVHRPRLLLLDEPTVGLDPQVRQELWSLIDMLRNSGTTILMSTHYIEEAERLADTVAIMSAGRIVALGRPADLIAEHAGRRALEFYGPRDVLTSVARRADELRLPYRRSGPALAVLCADDIDPAVFGLPAHPRPASLEDVFVRLTGEVVE